MEYERHAEFHILVNEAAMRFSTRECLLTKTLSFGKESLYGQNLSNTFSSSCWTPPRRLVDQFANFNNNRTTIDNISTVLHNIQIPNLQKCHLHRHFRYLRFSLQFSFRNLHFLYTVSCIFSKFFDSSSWNEWWHAEKNPTFNL